MHALAVIVAIACLVWGALVFVRGGLLGGSLLVLLAGACFGLQFFRLPTGSIPLTIDRILWILLIVQYAIWSRQGWAHRKPAGRQEYLLLAFIGWAQALVAGKLDEPAAQPAALAAVPAAVRAQPAPFRCPHDGCDRSFGSQQALNAHMRAHSNGSHQELAVVLAYGPEYGAGSDQ